MDISANNFGYNFKSKLNSSAARDRLVEGLTRNDVVTNLSTNFRLKDGSIWPGIMFACYMIQADRSGCGVRYHGEMDCVLDATCLPSPQ